MIHMNPGLGATRVRATGLRLTQADLDAANARRAAQLALESQGGVGGLPTIAWFVIGAAAVGGAAWFFWLRK